MHHDGVESKADISFFEQLDDMVLKALEVDSDVNEDRKREKLLDDSIDSFLTELTQERKQELGDI